MLLNEKSSIEENTERNIGIQTAKLAELIVIFNNKIEHFVLIHLKFKKFKQIEREAKEKIKGELENYRLSIMRIREKNLKMKYDLSMLRHFHGITKPFVFSYHSEFPNRAELNK